MTGVRDRASTQPMATEEGLPIIPPRSTTWAEHVKIECFRTIEPKDMEDLRAEARELLLKQRAEYAVKDQTCIEEYQWFYTDRIMRNKQDFEAELRGYKPA